MEYQPPLSSGKPDPAPALTRGLALLSRLGVDGPQTLEQLARATGWPKSSTLRLLRSLESAGAVTRDEAGKRYHALLRLTPLGRHGPDLMQRARQMLDQLCEQAGQAVELYEPNPQGLVMIDRREPEHAIVSVRARIGHQRDLSELESLAQVWLAHSGHQRPAGVGAWVWRQHRKAKVTASQADALVRQAREHRVAVDPGVNEHGVRRYAAPILDHDSLAGVIAIAQFCTAGQAQPSPTFRQAVHQAGLALSIPHHPSP